MIVSEDEESVSKSFRNLDRVLVTVPSELEVAHVVWARSLLVSQSALDAVQGRALMSLASESGADPPRDLREELQQIAQNQYTFKVHQDAHKTQIRQAVEELFEVKVERVNIVKVQAKPKRRGRILGSKNGWKKAIVQLRKGDTIEIFQGAQL